MSRVSLEGRHILVVEDDYLIAQDIRRDLERAGATVVGPAPSVVKALHLVQDGPALDGAVLDVNLGGTSSFPIAQALEAKAVPFLFATGYSSADIPAEWRYAPVAIKPIRIAAVEELLVARRAT